MASDVVQFREDRETLEFLRKRGLNPNEFGREAFERAVRYLRTKDAMDRLAARAKELPPTTTEEIVRWVREARDEH